MPQMDVAVSVRLVLLLLYHSALTQSSQNSVTIAGDTTSFVGAALTLTCSDRAGDVMSAQWLVNGTRLEDLNLENIEAIGIGGNILQIINIPLEYNGTTIQCIATLTSGEITYSNNATLLVQGLLLGVGSLTATPIPQESTVFLTWTPPFSLDVPGDPDVTYCVDVVNSTSSLVLHYECGITDPQYNYTVLPNSDIVCDTYIFIITPVNPVGNGTSANVTRGLLPSESTLFGPKVFSIKLLGDNSRLMVTLHVSAPVCSGSVSLQDIYNSSYTNGLGPIEVEPKDNSISFIVSNENDLNRLCNATFTLTSSAGSSSCNVNISTHDVQGITCNTTEPILTIDYIENTEALGALLALMYLDQDDTILCDQSMYAPIRRNEDFPLPTGGDSANINTYMGLAYDIERNGLVAKAYPAVRRYEYILGNMECPSGYASSCTVTYSKGTASVSCGDSASNVNGYQVILLPLNGRNNLTVVNVNSSPVTLSVPDGRYCILELPMKDNELMFNSGCRYSSDFTTEDSSPSTIVPVTSADIAIGFVVVFICMVLVTAIIVVCVATIRVKKKNSKIAINDEDNFHEASSRSVQLERLEKKKESVPFYTPVMPRAQRPTVPVEENNNSYDDQVLDMDSQLPTQNPSDVAVDMEDINKTPSQNSSDELAMEGNETPPPLPPQDKLLYMEINDSQAPPPVPPQNLSEAPPPVAPPPVAPPPVPPQDKLYMDIQAPHPVTPPPVPPQNLLEAPPPLPPPEPTKVAPPLPLEFLPDTPTSKETEEYSSAAIYDSVKEVKDDTTGQVAIETTSDGPKQEESDDRTYAAISPKPGSGISPPNVSVVNYEKITGSINQHGQNYCFVEPKHAPSFKPAGDGTAVVYSTLKKEDNSAVEESQNQDNPLRDECEYLDTSVWYTPMVKLFLNNYSSLKDTLICFKDGGRDAPVLRKTCSEECTSDSVFKGGEYVMLKPTTAKIPEMVYNKTDDCGDAFLNSYCLVREGDISCDESIQDVGISSVWVGIKEMTRDIVRKLPIFTRYMKKVENFGYAYSNKVKMKANDFMKVASMFSINALHKLKSIGDPAHVPKVKMKAEMFVVHAMIY